MVRLAVRSSKTHSVAFAIIMAMVSAGCSNDWDRVMKERYPYGVWLSRSGFTLYIQPDDTWRFCAPKNSRCSQGRLVWDSPRGDGLPPTPPYLLDFGTQTVPLSMLEQIPSFRFLQDDKPMHARHPDIHQFETKTSRFYCKGRPCVRFGGMDQKRFSFYLSDKPLPARPDS